MQNLDDTTLADTVSTEEDIKGLRVAFETLGCRSNYADTIDIQAALVERGAVPCGFDVEADVYVLNTCTVTDAADKTAMKLLRKARSKAPDARVVVTGCMAESGTEVLESSNLVDSVVGPGRRRQVLEAIYGIPVTPDAEDVKEQEVKKNRNIPQRKTISLLDEISPAISGPESQLGEVSNRSRYHLRVQEGCENTCTFCIIPYTRGQLSSRPLSRIIEDVHHLHAQGYREIVLTGTHLGGYGEDINSSLKELLVALDNESPIRRFRLSSIDPNDVDYELVDVLAKQHIFCNHLHICVQAFSDYTLKRMNRRYRLAEVFDIIGYINETMPGCCLGSDVITGFPGESREELDEAIEVFLSLPFCYLHVFPYSERSGTAATKFTEVVPFDERKRRSARWRALSEQRKEKFYRQLIGKDVEVVLETVRETEHGKVFTGTTREYVSVTLDISQSHSLFNASLGELVNVQGYQFDDMERKLRCK
jgi:threonylcarbamoyladenosine tRNA methylthiotransferase MtaB